MDKDQKEHKEFLELQLQWTREQVRILDEINGKLHEMKRIAEYTSSKYELTTMEIGKLNGELNVLKHECDYLEKQLLLISH